MGKRQISFFIENELWKKFSIMCIKKDNSKTKILVEAVKRFVKEK